MAKRQRRARSQAARRSSGPGRSTGKNLKDSRRPSAKAPEAPTAAAPAASDSTPPERSGATSERAVPGRATRLSDVFNTDVRLRTDPPSSKASPVSDGSGDVDARAPTQSIETARTMIQAPGAAPFDRATLPSDGAPPPGAPDAEGHAPVVHSTPAPFSADGMPSSAAHVHLGTIIDGRYLVESVLGEGGMGFVYRCRHRVIDKLVAIKILRQEIARDPEVTGRFVNEARAASAIGNPHIVDTVDFGQLPDGSTYFAMEYLDGRTLTAIMSAEPALALSRILSIGKQIAEALGAAHDAGIVHRDLKPDNVFIVQRGKQSDFVKILDFGIAKVATVQNKLTRAGAVFGTPHYMSPEQARGSNVDHRTDIYALGVILFEMCAGRVPFDAEAPMSILSQHIHEPPPRLTQLEDLPQQVPPGLEAVIFKCLAKDPDERYRSMGELVDELERVEQGSAPEARLPTPTEPVRAPGSRRRASMLAAIVAAPLVGLTVLAALLAPRVEGSLPLLIRHTKPSTTAVVLQVLAGAEAEAQAPAPLKAGRHEVHLIMLPIDAEAFRGDERLGAMPVTLRVAQGERVELSVRRDGHYPKRVIVDGSKARVVVRLTPIPGAQPARPVPDAGVAKVIEQLEKGGSAKASTEEGAALDTGDVRADAAAPAADEQPASKDVEPGGDAKGGGEAKADAKGGEAKGGEAKADANGSQVKGGDTKGADGKSGDAKPGVAEKPPESTAAQKKTESAQDPKAADPGAPKKTDSPPSGPAADKP